jgi:hypothetical protein
MLEGSSHEPKALPQKFNTLEKSGGRLTNAGGQLANTSVASLTGNLASTPQKRIIMQLAQPCLTCRILSKLGRPSDPVCKGDRLYLNYGKPRSSARTP